MNEPKFALVALPLPSHEHFDYLLPTLATSSLPKLGTRVKVPFGKKQRIGVLVNYSSHSAVPRGKLKTICAFLETSPLLNNNMLELAHWLKEYYHYPLGEVLDTMLPTLALEDTPLHLKACLAWQVNPKADTAIKLTAKQTEVLKLIAAYPQGISHDELSFYSVSPRILKTLVEKSLIISSEKQAQNIEFKLLETPFIPNEEQNYAITKIIQELHHYKTFVLDGITGSGKTEVYLQIITEVLKKQQQALILVPEIGLTPQTISRFEKRFNCKVAIFHSNLSPDERLQSWLQAKYGMAKIIIGTRSAIFTPTENLGIIIVDEAHDASFKQQEGLKYHARDVAVKRGQIENIPVILGSATHALETLYNAKRERFELLSLNQRTGNAFEPNYYLLDIRNHYLIEGLSPKVLDKIQEKLKLKEQVLIFLNRRGYAPTLMCHHCAWLAHCTQCDARLTYHLEPLHLHCHHCDATKPIYTHCPSCQSHQLITLGVGTVKLEQVFTKHFPDAKILRIDRDSTRKKNALNKYLEEIHQGEADILIGTQMLAKGHHFPNVTLVVIVDGDSGFFSADFRGSERFAQLLIQVAGRAGRAEKRGEVIIQTRKPDHPQLQTLIDKGYHAFVDMLLNERKTTLLPPFSFLALIRSWHARAEKVHELLNQIKSLGIKHHTAAIQLLGPIDAPMAKRAGKYHSQLLIQANNRHELKQFLSLLLHDIRLLPSAKNIRWSLDVDPIDLF